MDDLFRSALSPTTELVRIEVYCEQQFGIDARILKLGYAYGSVMGSDMDGVPPTCERISC